MRLGPCGPSTKRKCGLPCLKMIKNFKTLIAKSKTKCEALVSREPCVTTQVAWPWSQTWLQQGASCKFWGFKKVETLLCQQRSIVKAIVFPVVTYGCENWTIKKAECQRTDAFELWCWRRLLRVPWTARRSNQSILKKISPGCSLEGLMLKLKLQYFDHLMQRADSFEKTLILGKI